MPDGLDGELFTCAVCGKQFPSTEGAWPAQSLFGDFAVQHSGKIDGSFDDGEFCCYEHCPDGPFREDQTDNIEGETVLDYLWREKMGIGKALDEAREKEAGS